MLFRRYFFGRGRLMLALLVVLVVAGVGLAFSYPAAAQTTLKETATKGNGLGEAIFLILNTILWGMTKLFAMMTYIFVSILIIVARYNTFLNAPVVQSGWPIVRDLMNMMFIIALIIIAAGTVLRLQNYRYNRLLGKLIIMAFLVNFSKFIAVFLLQFAQVVMLTFVNAFRDAAFGNFSSMFGLDSVFQFSTSGTVGSGGGFSIFISMIAGLAMMIVAFVVTLSMTVMLFVRIIALWMLIILSPIAYALRILPNTEKYASQWWSEFTKYAVLGPVLAFFLWLALAVVAATPSCSQPGCNNPLGTDPAVKADMASADQDSAGLRGDLVTNILSVDKMVTFVVSIIFLMMGLQYAQKSGAAGASFAGKVAATGFGVAGAVTGYNAIKDRTVAPVQGWLKNRAAARQSAIQERTETVEAAGDRVKARFGPTQGARERGQAAANAYERNRTARTAQKQGYKDMEDEALQEKFQTSTNQRERLAAMTELSNRGHIDLNDEAQNTAFEYLTNYQRETKAGFLPAYPLADAELPRGERQQLREKILDQNMKSQSEDTLRQHASMKDEDPAKDAALRDRRIRATQELDRRQLLKANNDGDAGLVSQLENDVSGRPEDHRKFKESLMKSSPDMAMRVLFNGLKTGADREAYKSAIQQRQISTSSMSKGLYQSLDDDEARKELVDHLVAISPDAATLHSFWSGMEPEAAAKFGKHIDMTDEASNDRRFMVAKETGEWDKAFTDKDGFMMTEKEETDENGVTKKTPVAVAQEYFDKMGRSDLVKSLSNSALENGRVVAMAQASENFGFKGLEEVRTRSKESRASLAIGLEERMKQLQGNEYGNNIDLAGKEPENKVLLEKEKQMIDTARHLFLATKGETNLFDLSQERGQEAYRSTIYGASAADLSKHDKWIEAQKNNPEAQAFAYQEIGATATLGTLHDLLLYNKTMAKKSFSAAEAELKTRIGAGEADGATSDQVDEGVRAKNRLRSMARDPQIGQYVSYSSSEFDEPKKSKPSPSSDTPGKTTPGFLNPLPDKSSGGQTGKPPSKPAGGEPTGDQPKPRVPISPTAPRKIVPPPIRPTAPTPEPEAPVDRGATAAPEPELPKVGKTEALSDIDRAKYERTKAMARQYEKFGGDDAFFMSRDYLDDSAGYLSPAEYAQAGKNAARGIEPLGGIATFGQRKMLGYDSRLPEFAAFQNAGEYITDPKRKQEFAAAYIPMIDQELGKLQSSTSRTSGEEARMAKLEQVKAALSNPDELKNLQLVNRGRLGYSDRHTIAHERTHAKLDEIDADGGLRTGIMAEMKKQEPKVLRDILGAVRQKMGNQELTDTQAFDEYLTEGIVNSKQSWADTAPDAIQIDPKIMAKIQSRAAEQLDENGQALGEKGKFAFTAGELGKFKATGGAGNAVFAAYQAKTNQAMAANQKKIDQERAERAVAKAAAKAEQEQIAAAKKAEQEKNGDVPIGQRISGVAGKVGNAVSEKISGAQRGIDQAIERGKQEELAKKQAAFDAQAAIVAQKMAAVKQATIAADDARNKERTGTASAATQDQKIAGNIKNLVAMRDGYSAAGNLQGVQAANSRIDGYEKERRDLRKNQEQQAKERREAEKVESRAKAEAGEAIDVGKVREEELSSAQAKVDPASYAIAQRLAKTQQSQSEAKELAAERLQQVIEAQQQEKIRNTTIGEQRQHHTTRLDEINNRLSVHDPQRSVLEERSLRSEQRQLQQEMKGFDARSAAASEETKAAAIRLAAAEKAEQAADEAVAAVIKEQKAYTKPPKAAAVTSVSTAPETVVDMDPKKEFGHWLNGLSEKFRDGSILQSFGQLSDADYPLAAKELRDINKDYLVDKRVPSEKIPEYQERVKRAAQWYKSGGGVKSDGTKVEEVQSRTQPVVKSRPAPAEKTKESAPTSIPRPQKISSSATPTAIPSPNATRSSAERNGTQPNIDAVLTQLASARAEDMAGLHKIFEQGVKHLEQATTGGANATAKSIREQFSRLPNDETGAVDHETQKRLFKEFGEELKRTLSKNGTGTVTPKTGAPVASPRSPKSVKPTA